MDQVDMILPAIQTPVAELELIRAVEPGHRHILTREALQFVASLVQRYTPRLRELLEARQLRQAEFDAGALPGFDPATREIRESDWRVAEIPAQVLDRRTEITGPVSRKMVINALNSGAQVYMADFEDSTAPSWSNLVEGQVNLFDAIRRQIDFTTPEGKVYALGENTAVLMVRPRGLHLPERHLRFEGKPVPGSLVDFGLYLYHNHAELARRGSQPYFYLPKLQDHAEAAWWDEIIAWSELELGIDHGTVRVTVLLETLPAVFQMDEILHALRDRILGLNCGRWDYIFSYIKTLRNHADRVLPDRGQVTMTVPFLRNYSHLLVRTCHRRGAFAMGGMAAQIPIKGDEEANAQALQRVLADKQREAGDGYDGTWVAHPGLEAMARTEFDRVMTGPNQIDKPLDDFDCVADDLLEPCAGEITEQGVRGNIRVAILYLAAWLQGNGCVPIDHLMEDAATAEIGRAQLWQWARHGAQLDDGRVIDHDWLAQLFEEEKRPMIADATNGRIQAVNLAATLLEGMTMSTELEEFLTLPAYRHLRD
jgi:malate synthase